jgi:NADH:ubiquinone oxidoreductase subunit E
MTNEHPITEVATDNWSEVEAASKAVLPRVVLAHIAKVTKLEHPESHLISTLHKVQDTMGYIGPEQLDAISQLMQIPAAKVTGVATFYHFFRLRPKGRFVISICMGTACYVKGAAAITDAICRELHVSFGETTADGIFSLEQARCLGVCGLAPVIMIDNQIHGPLSPEKVPALLEEYRKKAAEKVEAKVES